MLDTYEAAALVLLVVATGGVVIGLGAVRFHSWKEKRRIRSHFRSKTSGAVRERR